MTEERKKELIKIWAKRITTVGWCWCIEDLIRTVAAEAREEGIDEAIGRAKSACYDSSMGLDNMCWMERRLDREAERLKGKR